MGQSTDAILFFGYTWGEEGELEGLMARAPDVDEDDARDWEEIVAKRRGHVNPWDKHESGGNWCDDNREAIDEWNAIKMAIGEEFGGVDIGTHCSGDYPIAYLFVWQMRVNRGYPESLAVLPEITDAQRQGMARWFAEFGVEPPEDAPQFWLASDWT